MNEFKFLFNRLPFYVIFYPTSRCNALCSHCYNFNRQSGASRDVELTVGEIEKISRNFGHIKVLTISGGEPFLREDLFEIVSVYCKNNGVQYVSFHTNAFLTDRVVDIVSRLAERFPKVTVFVCISIDAVGEAHDRIRGVKNGFDKILDTIARLKEAKKIHNNIFLVSSAVFSHATEASFEQTIHYIQKNIGDIKPALSFIRGSVKDEKEKDIDFRKYQEFYERFLPEMERDVSPFSSIALKEAMEIIVNKVVVNNYEHQRQTVPCQAGRKLVVIYENGEVCPCETLRKSFGNLRDVDYDIKRLLFAEKGNEIKRDIRRGKTCSCTWENIIPVNLLFSPKHYFQIFRAWRRLFIK